MLLAVLDIIDFFSKACHNFIWSYKKKWKCIYFTRKCQTLLIAEWNLAVSYCDGCQFSAQCVFCNSKKTTEIKPVEKRFLLITKCPNHGPPDLPQRELRMITL